jgi:hypothetical protein
MMRTTVSLFILAVATVSSGVDLPDGSGRIMHSFVSAAERFDRQQSAVAFVSGVGFPTDSDAPKYDAAAIAAVLGALGEWAVSRGYDTSVSDDTIWAVSSAHQGLLSVGSRTAAVGMRTVRVENRCAIRGEGLPDEGIVLCSVNGVLCECDTDLLLSIDLVARLAGAGVYIAEVGSVSDWSGVYVVLAVRSGRH